MLNDRTWITDTSEVLTTIGWVPIKSIEKVDKLITLDETGRLVCSKLLEYNVRNYEGKLPTRKSSTFIQGFLYPYQNGLWTPMGSKELLPTKNLEFKGRLFNVVTETNTVIIRVLFNGKHNNDYIVCQTAL